MTFLVNDYEIARIIGITSRLRERFRASFPDAEPNAHWNIVSHLMKAHMEGRAVTMSALVQVSGLSYGSAMRRLHEMLDTHLIARVPRGKSGKSFDLVPGKALIAGFETYARDFKLELARAVGQKAFDDDDSYFLGGAHQKSAFGEQDLIDIKRVPSVESARFLFYRDYFFMSIRHVWSDFRWAIGPAGNFTLCDLTDLHEEILRNASRDVSAYDIIAVNAPWIGEFASKGVISDLTAIADEHAIRADDFHPQVWQMGNWLGGQFGIPAYATVMALSARSDLFKEAGLNSPTTFRDVIAAGRQLHHPDRGRYGILWSGRRGPEIASTFLFLLGCGVRPVPGEMGGGNRIDDHDRLEELLNSDLALEVLEYMQDLLSISPPDILDIGWTDSIERFLRGQAAMAYAWSMHASRFETDIGSVVKRKVAYLPPPSSRPGRGLAPLGGFLLTIPSNLPPERKSMAGEVLGWMLGPRAAKVRARDGLPLSPLFSLAGDLEAGAHSPIYRLARSLAQKGALCSWLRPSTPQYFEVEGLVGEAVHDALLGVKSHKDALSNAIDQIRKSN